MKKITFLLLFSTQSVFTTFLQNPVYDFDTGKILLPLPEPLADQALYVYWKMGEELIATTFTNGTLFIMDLKYQDILSSSDDGSLLISVPGWETNGRYSVEILTNTNLTTVHFTSNVINPKYRKDPDIITVSGIVGEDLVLPVEDDIFEQSEIEQIDWLTERWVYFAGTKTGGKIHIHQNKYVGRLKSLADGSLTFTPATMEDEGIYRACILYSEGRVLEKMYQVNIIFVLSMIDEELPEFHSQFGTAHFFLNNSFEILVYILCVISVIFFIYSAIKTEKLRQRRQIKNHIVRGKSALYYIGEPEFRKGGKAGDWSIKEQIKTLLDQKSHSTRKGYDLSDASTLNSNFKLVSNLCKLLDGLPVDEKTSKNILQTNISTVISFPTIPQSSDSSCNLHVQPCLCSKDPPDCTLTLS